TGVSAAARRLRIVRLAPAIQPSCLKLKGSTMKKTTAVLIAGAFVAGFAVRSLVPGGDVAHAQARPRVYELRTYTAVPGRLDALHARFKDHLLGYFQKHGMKNVIYFKPMD